MAEKPVDVPQEKVEYGPGDPVEVPAVSQLGATFAERSGKKAPAKSKPSNSTFGDRSKASAKQVKSDDTEDKAVRSASTKAKK